MDDKGDIQESVWRART